MASELDNLKVYGETEVGWDENTPPNEKLDGKGNVIPADDLHREDPFAPKRCATSCAGITGCAALTYLIPMK